MRGLKNFDNHQNKMAVFRTIYRVFCALMLCYQSYQAITRYLSYPIATESQTVPLGYVHVPGLTICNFEQLLKDKMAILERSLVQVQDDYYIKLVNDMRSGRINASETTLMFLELLRRRMDTLYAMSQDLGKSY